MRTLKQAGFAGEACQIEWCACVRCGALGPCLTTYGYDDRVKGVVGLRYWPVGCCGPGMPRQIRRGGLKDQELIV